MTSQKILITSFEYSYHLISEGIREVTHPSSLVQPAGGGNPANWILGHILTSRSNIMAMLGLDPAWDFERCQPYLPDSEPFSPGKKVEDFEKMKTTLEQTQAVLLKTILKITEDELDIISGENTLAEELAGYAIHEAFHAGELNILKN